MNTQSQKITVLLAGSRDFLDRFSLSLNSGELSPELGEILAVRASLSEIRALTLEHRPSEQSPTVLLLEMPQRCSKSELGTLRTLLAQLRDRFRAHLKIVLAVSSPEIFSLAGSLLFADDSSLSPSYFLDNLIISPPSGVIDSLSLEQQFLNYLEYHREFLLSSPSNSSLPALLDESWAPVMCDPKSREVWMRWLPRYARYTNESPLIVGPTGSGKTKLAAAIHKLSARSGPFISITPRDFSSNELVQAELFGAAAGAYTGAVDRWGLVAKAEKGTLFIDELQSIDRDLQGKLITFIENKTYRRVGEAESQQADVRFIFATNRSLAELVADGSLRDDFAYRLERLQLNLPALSERRLDIAAGACYALAKIMRERHRAELSEGEELLSGFTLLAYRELWASSWPGNLRQVENTLAKLVEISSVQRQLLVDEKTLGAALKASLGFKELSSGDILSQSAERVAKLAAQGSIDSLEGLSQKLKETARTLALEVSGGDSEKSALILKEPKSILELFSAARGVNHE